MDGESGFIRAGPVGAAAQSAFMILPRRYCIRFHGIRRSIAVLQRRLPAFEATDRLVSGAHCARSFRIKTSAIVENLSDMFDDVRFAGVARRLITIGVRITSAIRRRRRRARPPCATEWRDARRSNTAQLEGLRRHDRTVRPGKPVCVRAA